MKMADLRLIFVSLFFTITNVHVSSRTHDSWYSKTYYLMDKRVTWYDARMICEEEGMRLATVQNANDQGLLRTALKNHRASLFNCYWIAAKKVGGEFYWFGLQDRPVTWSDWGSSIILDIFKKEKCAKVWNEEAKWYEKDCYTKCSFACEKYDIPFCD